MGVAYIRVWSNNKVTMNENDTVYRQLTQGAENAKFNDIRDKVSAHIVALDIVLEILMSEILLKA